MRTIVKPRTLGIVLNLLRLCSCATEDSIRPELSAELTTLEHKECARAIGDSVRPPLPADVTINEDAGRGGFLFVTLRLESGEELPFIVDTGSPGTLLDK